MPDTFQKNDKFGGFVIVAKISMGEFGETWLCENPITNRKAVLKGLKEDIYESAGSLVENFDIVTRTKEEAQIVAALGDNHFPFVPQLLDAVQLGDDRVFFLTEFVDGMILGDWLQQSDLALELKASFAVAFLSAVNQLHGVGIVHRDLSGDNVIVSEAGRPKIVDFGLASIKSELLITKYSAKTADPFTKAKYTPPKVLQARLQGGTVETTESWDLYAAGVLLFELFASTSVRSPHTDITRDAINQLPCHSTIQMLLDNGQTDNAPRGIEIAIALNRELRLAGVDSAVTINNEDVGAVDSLREEIRQLEADLRSNRGQTDISDIANYLTRMGLVYTVVPSKKVITLEYSSIHDKPTRFIIDGSSDEMLSIHTMGMRTIKSKRNELHKALNAINWNSTILKVTYDPGDGEVRMGLYIPHKHCDVPYDEFVAQFAALLTSADTLAMALDKQFSSPQRRAIESGTKNTETATEAEDDSPVAT